MNIQDTGVRGYLKWLQRDQPGLYVLAAPVIAQRVPEAFSDHEQSRAMGSLWGFGDDVTDTASGTSTFFGSSSDSASAGDVASVANPGAASPNVTSTISNIVSAIGQVFLAKSQVDTLKQVNNLQLQRAAAGLPPLNTSSLQLGVPQVQVGLNQSTMTGAGIALAALVGLGGLWLLLGRGGSRRPAHA